MCRNLPMYRLEVLGSLQTWAGSLGPLQKLQGTSGPLILTEEEKRTLIAEGYPIPNKLPLSKTEEKALKRVRRKIKNKISAQESRRKKKEYLECLEKKVESFTSENNQLWKKVETLESTNRVRRHVVLWPRSDCRPGETGAEPAGRCPAPILSRALPGPASLPDPSPKEDPAGGKGL